MVLQASPSDGCFVSVIFFGGLFRSDSCQVSCLDLVFLCIVGSVWFTFEFTTKILNKCVCLHSRVSISVKVVILVCVVHLLLVSDRFFLV